MIKHIRITHACSLACLVLLIYLLAKTSPVHASNVEVSDARESACRFGGSFEQSKSVDGLPTPIVSKGTFLYDCEHGVVWSASSPYQDVLIMRLIPGTSDSSQTFRLKDGELEQLKSRQASFITELIISLIAQDEASLNTHFEKETINQDQLKLIPKKRAMKRAVKQIIIRRSPDTDSVQIRLIDRNAQPTDIKASRDEPSQLLGRAQCQPAAIPIVACDLLFQQTAQN